MACARIRTLLSSVLATAIACGDDAGDQDPDGTETSTTQASGSPTTTSGSTTSTTTTAEDTASGSGVDSSSDETGEPVDLSGLSDDFEDGDLNGWQQYRPAEATLRVEAGELLFEPVANSLWFNASAAAQLYKEVPGDFMVTATVTARSTSQPGQPPAPQFRLGGLMARDGASSDQNYVFIVIGADGNDVSVETKTTTNSVSQFSGPPWPSATGDLRVCRIGSSFQLLIREAGGAWQLQETFERPDLPHRLQVGPLAYANNSPPDLRVSYESVDFANVETAADCTK